MKVLCVNYAISEFGGIEFAALNLASGLFDRGHEVHFLAAKDQKAPLTSDSGGMEPLLQIRHPGIHRHYRAFPRSYAVGDERGFFQKCVWHIQDTAHPRNEKLFAEVLEQVRPDLIILHNITAIGVNIYRTIKAAGIPCIQVIHDLSLICLNMMRFKSGRRCSGLCTKCRIKSFFRFSFMHDAPNFAFVSPSRATLQEIERYADLSRWRRKVIPNPNVFLVNPRKKWPLERPRLLYVGRLEPHKGVEMMLRAVHAAHPKVDFQFDVLGTGVLECSLRRKYAHCPWLKFHGSVDQAAVAEFMSTASVLLVPSQWLETVPGVAVHALFAGLPVLGSRIGGIPEHVIDGETGRLLPPADEAAWSAAIVNVVSDPQQVAAWSEACLRVAQKFDPKLALDKYERLMNEMRSGG